MCGGRIPIAGEGRGTTPTVYEGLANEEVTVRAVGRGAEARRVQEIDAVASMLPMARCDRLAELLTEADIATLKHTASCVHW